MSLIISYQFKIFIKRRFLYRSRPHHSSDHQTFNSNALRTFGREIGMLRHSSQCQEILRLDILNGANPPIPRSPDIPGGVLNGHANHDQYQGEQH